MLLEEIRERRQRTAYTKSKFFTFALLPLLVMIVVVSCMIYNKRITFENSVNSISHIRKYYHNGEIVDYSKDLEIYDTSTDIYWVKGSKYAEVHYGNVTLLFTPQELVRKDVRSALELIGITMHNTGENGKLELFFNGEKIIREDAK